jgi:hypothetical protein
MGALVPILYRCPTTGLRVQGLFAEDAFGNECVTYESVTCLACNQMHLVNGSTGRVLGAGDQPPLSRNKLKQD